MSRTSKRLPATCLLVGWGGFCRSSDFTSIQFKNFYYRVRVLSTPNEQKEARTAILAGSIFKKEGQKAKT